MAGRGMGAATRGGGAVTGGPTYDAKSNEGSTSTKTQVSGPQSPRGGGNPKKARSGKA